MSDDYTDFRSWLRALRERPGFLRRRSSEYPVVMRDGELYVAYQPIVSLDHGGIFAHETLVRSRSAAFRNPPALFAEAIAINACGVLGRRLREFSLVGCPDVTLFLNIHPKELDESWLVQPDDPIFAHTKDIYLEITESVPLSHFKMCQSILAEVRSKGVKLAIDDFGAGYSNVKYIADLEPEMVKLDRELVTNLDQKPRQRKLVTNLVRLCHDMGARVIAEGIETEGEAKAAIDCGANYGQGWFFARPAENPPAIDKTALAFLQRDRNAKKA